MRIDISQIDLFDELRIFIDVCGIFLDWNLLFQVVHTGI